MKGKSKKSQNSATHKHSNRKPERKKLPIALISIVAFAIFTWCLLFFRYALYLVKIESLSLWLPTKMFYADCMTVPGGALMWLACYIIQFFHLPWLGASIFTILLVAIQLTAIKAFKVSREWVPATAFVPALILLAFTNLGYLIFTLRPAGFALTPALGVLLSLLILWAYRRLRQWWLQALVILALVAVGYPYLGFYALFAAALCAAANIRGRKPLPYIPVLVAVAAIALLPRMWFAHGWSHLMPSQIYTSPLPQFYVGEIEIRVLYCCIFAMLLILSFLSARSFLSQKMSKRLGVTGWIASLVFVGLYAYNDANFRTTLALDRALWDQDWPRAVKIAGNMPQQPTRLNTVLADIALMRAGEAPNRLFSINYGWEPYNTPRSGRAIHDGGGALISYHLGLVNYAYRWAMEYSIAQSMSVERLKMLAKCALLNYELPLAKTYLDILYNMPMHRQWAKKYLRYQANPMEMNSDPELVAVRMLMCRGNEFINDHGAFESYIWPKLADASTIGSPQYNEQGMQAALITRDLDNFMQRLAHYKPTGRVPRYYQEAALLWSLLSKQPCPIPIDPDIEAHHKQFLNTFRNTSNLEAEAQRDAMRQVFGDTYWFYFVFTENMSVI